MTFFFLSLSLSLSDTTLTTTTTTIHCVYAAHFYALLRQNYRMHNYLFGDLDGRPILWLYWMLTEKKNTNGTENGQLTMNTPEEKKPHTHTQKSLSEMLEAHSKCQQIYALFSKFYIFLRECVCMFIFCSMIRCWCCWYYCCWRCFIPILHCTHKSGLHTHTHIHTVSVKYPALFWQRKCLQNMYGMSNF